MIPSIVEGATINWLGNVIEKPNAQAPLSCEKNFGEIMVGDQKKISYEIFINNPTTLDAVFSCLNCGVGATFTGKTKTQALLEWDTTNVDLSQFVGEAAIFKITATVGVETINGNACIKVNPKQVNVKEAVEKFIVDSHPVPPGYEGPLPDCAFYGSCRNFEDLVQLAIDIVDWFFSIIAGIAFAFFVYGGITMVLSFGNSEKVGKGRQILVAAAIGLAIAFSAYVIVDFVVDAIGITQTLPTSL